MKDNSFEQQKLKHPTAFCNQWMQKIFVVFKCSLEFTMVGVVWILPDSSSDWPETSDLCVSWDFEDFFFQVELGWNKDRPKKLLKMYRWWTRCPRVGLKLKQNFISSGTCRPLQCLRCWKEIFEFNICISKFLFDKLNDREFFIEQNFTGCIRRMHIWEDSLITLFHSPEQHIHTYIILYQSMIKKRGKNNAKYENASYVEKVFFFSKRSLDWDGTALELLLCVITSFVSKSFWIFLNFTISTFLLFKL